MPAFGDWPITRNQPKIHLIPIAAGVKYAICSTKPREGGRLAVHTRREFNKLPQEEKCKRCEAILNGRT